MTEQNRTPAGVPTGGQFAATDRPEPTVRLVADEAIPPRLPVPLAGGGEYAIRREHLAAAIGVDHDGNLIVEEPDSEGPYLVALTACCQATATGTEDGIACRGCYREIDPSIGAPVDESEIADWFEFPNTPEMNLLRAEAAVVDAREFALARAGRGVVAFHDDAGFVSGTARCGDHLNPTDLAAWLTLNPRRAVTYSPASREVSCDICRTTQ